ncbi:hypothetical protein B0H34DRAFT_799387 [Crassisporium funariophilum]|nr:hypothetical protein B0H34DRAFT_799387 [Crassisporium funariophilum]
MPETTYQFPAIAVAPKAALVYVIWFYQLPVIVSRPHIEFPPPTYQHPALALVVVLSRIPRDDVSTSGSRFYTNAALG